MTTSTPLIDAIIAGIREKKGRAITVCDLSHIDTAPARAFVICTCGSPQQVDAVVDSVEEQTAKLCAEKPSAIAGRANAQWVAMDYGTAMVHLFVPEARAHYDIENLWGDAAITALPDED